MQECRFRIIFPGDLLDFTITAFDLLSQRLHFFQQRFQRLPQLRRQRDSSSDTHLVGITLW
jgi:hypothetical protein